MTGRIQLLRAALVANLLFSATTGSLLLLRADALAGWIGGVGSLWLSLIGFGLIAFAGAIAVVAWRPTPLRALTVTVLDLGWVAFTIPWALLVSSVTPEGRVATLVVAAIVSAFAMVQTVGLKRMMRSADPERGMWRHCVRVSVDAPPEAMWSVIADLGSIARFSPSLASSRVDGGLVSGPGAVRTCTNAAGAEWSEECEVFDVERRSLTLRFLADREGFPFPARVMHGGWTVEPREGGSTVEVWWTLTPRGRFGWLLVALMGAGVDRDFAAMIARMAEVAQGRPLPEVPPRLRPSYC